MELYNARNAYCNIGPIKFQNAYYKKNPGTETTTMFVTCQIKPPKDKDHHDTAFMFTKGTWTLLTYSYSAFLDAAGNLLVRGKIPSLITASITNFLGNNFNLTIPGLYAALCDWSDPPAGGEGGGGSACYQGSQGGGIGCYCSAEGCASGSCHFRSGTADQVVPKGGYVPGGYPGQEKLFTCECK